ncbi:MAG: hemerythrin domain-containing protein [Spirochaetales bacterium]|nr:hemerythrin domain-containing protein [Spirochaetales bacterium]
MNHIKGKETLSELATVYPYIVDILNQYRLDYTFNSETTLKEAVEKAGLSYEKVNADINLAIDEYIVTKPEVIYWENEPIHKIIDHIETKHHRFMEKTMDEILRLFHAMELTPELESLEKLFGELQAEILTHQIKEEEELFPLLKEYSGNRNSELRKKCVSYMEKTMGEHEQAGQVLKNINSMTDNFMPPVGATAELKKLYLKLNALEKDTFLHIHMENSILFKMI